MEKYDILQLDIIPICDKQSRTGRQKIITKLNRINLNDNNTMKI